MSKAARNMLTETEAAEARRSALVAVNSVDLGYMSADPQWMESLYMSDKLCPFGWEDGAARVLSPVAIGEKGNPSLGAIPKAFPDRWRQVVAVDLPLRAIASDAIFILQHPLTYSDRVAGVNLPKSLNSHPRSPFRVTHFLHVPATPQKCLQLLELLLEGQYIVVIQ